MFVEFIIPVFNPDTAKWSDPYTDEGRVWNLINNAMRNYYIVRVQLSDGSVLIGEPTLNYDWEDDEDELFTLNEGKENEKAVAFNDVATAQSCDQWGRRLADPFVNID
jgi:hypothetical protein